MDVKDCWAGEITDPTTDSRLLFRRGPGGTVEIVDLHVGGEYRREGVGRKMVDLLVDGLKFTEYRRVYAITRAENRIAQDFYRGTGFRLCGALKGFYPEGDAIMFVRNVP